MNFNCKVKDVVLGSDTLKHELGVLLDVEFTLDWHIANISPKSYKILGVTIRNTKCFYYIEAVMLC